ncbi:Fungal Zn2-Cys6 binuclear cluster domain-containing protein [Teratosphaeria destructans]|uniref:Fungal Zn2-Cys6 binuclear cluster domain-containing protein n=1 Tax=Teratosphaeria destructans TaxID=418781 RepID=A0A9W7W341_9PEZI|nr:Fungal Zn2-Cys6 binuclear cluster domain-containing protein [Teratosphaeria destructans]
MEHHLASSASSAVGDIGNAMRPNPGVDIVAVPIATVYTRDNWHGEDARAPLPHPRPPRRMGTTETPPFCLRGGRSFKKSRFGKCLEAGVKLIRNEDGGIDTDSKQAPSGFVYSGGPLSTDTPIPKAPSNDHPTVGFVKFGSLGNDATSGGDDNAERKDSMPSATASNTKCIPRPPDPLISLPLSLRELWDHAFRRSLPLLSTHQGSCDRLCATLFPLALGSPHLQAAITALAATHRRAAGLSTGPEVPRLRFRSVRLLRDAIEGPLHPSELEKLLATALVLCLADLASSDGEALLFRTHLSGAACMIRQMERLGLAERKSATLRPLIRLYNSLQTVIHACAFRNFEESPVRATGDLDKPGVDDMTGFSTALIPIFKGVNQLHSIVRSQQPFDCKGHYYSPVRYCKSLLEHHSQILFERVTAHMEFQRECGIMLSAPLPANIANEITVLNEAWHHAALIQIWTHGELHSEQLSLHGEVDKIIALVQSLKIVAGPCPAIGAVPVLFIAGGVARADAQKDAIRALLRQMEACFGMGNVRSTMRYLETLWADRGIVEVYSPGAPPHGSAPSTSGSSNNSVVLKILQDRHLSAVEHSVHHKR